MRPPLALALPTLALPTLTLCLAGLAPTRAAAAIGDCLRPAGEARTAGDPARAIELCTAALADPACADARTHLEMLCARSHHDLARKRGGDAWCAARDAYAPLRESPNPAFAAAAREAYAETDAACRGDVPDPDGQCPPCDQPACPACPALEAPPPKHWWFTGPGIGLIAVGGALLGLGIDAHLTANALADDLDDRTATVPNTAIEQRQSEGARLGLLTGGAVVTAVGLAALTTGLVLALGSDEDAPTARILPGPGGAALGVRF